MGSKDKATLGDGPRITTEHKHVTRTDILVTRGKDHPAGPGTTNITVYEPKK